MTPQKIVLVIGLLVFGLSGLYPPWARIIHQSGFHQKRDAGYAFIATPPKPLYPEEGVEIDLTRMLVQSIGIAAGTGILWLLTSRSGKAP